MNNNTKDIKFQQDAKKIAKLFLTNMNLNPNEIPQEYTDMFTYEYSDGDVCYLSLLSKITLPENYSEVSVDNLIDRLLKVNPDSNSFSEIEAISEISLEMVLQYAENQAMEGIEDFSEVDYAEIDSNRLGTFFKRIISTVYTPGVTRLEENPSKENNYLALNDDVTKCGGAFFDEEDRYEFIIEKVGKNWEISYSPDVKTKAKLEEEQG